MSDLPKLPPGYALLPEEPTREMLEAIEYAPPPAADWVRPAYVSYRALYQHLTRPKTVEVWRVEWAQYGACGWLPCVNEYTSEPLARQEAETMQSGHGYRCIRVTGPHQQEVPND